MRKDEVIQKLARLNGNPQVVILDNNRNSRDIAGQASPEGSSDGIHTDFCIQMLSGDELAEGQKPVIAFLFEADPEPGLVNALERLFQLENHYKTSEAGRTIMQGFKNVFNDLRKFLPNEQL